jgi:hypothetical protein
MSKELKIKDGSDTRVLAEGKDAHIEAHEAPDAHPKGLQLALLTLSLMFAVFIMALDTTILCTFIFLSLALEP